MLGCGIAAVVVALWIGIWSACTLYFDRCLLQSVVQQFLALNYATAQGVVTASRVVTTSDGEGTADKPEIHYRYAVGGQEFTGERVAYGPVASAGFLEADRIARRFPHGARVTVYYNPENTADSLLVPGPTTGQAFMALFLVPFNLIMLVAWLGLGGWLRSFRPGRLPLGAGLQLTYDGFALHLWNVSPLAVAALTLGGVAIAGIFIVGLGVLFLPAEVSLLIVWTAAIGLSAWMYRRQWRRATVLEINELRGTFEIRDAVHRRPKTSGSLEELQAVVVRERIKTDSEGHVSRTYNVGLALRRGQQRLGRRCLVAGWSKPLATQLVNWIAERLKLPVHSPLA
jgi:Protein of unknown function (DUF3592)